MNTIVFQETLANKTEMELLELTKKCIMTLQTFYFYDRECL